MPTIAYFVAFIALGLVVGSLGPTLPDLAQNTLTSPGQISILFTVQALGLLLGNIVSGRWYDRRAAHPFLALAFLATALMLFLTPGMSSLPALAAIMLVIGFGAGSIDVGGNTLLVWVHGSSAGPRMNALHACFGIGAFLSPSLMRLVAEATGGIASAYRLLALLVVLPAFLFLRLPSPANAGTEGGQQAGRARPLLVILMAGLFFLYVGAELSFGGWIYSYALALNLATATGAGYLNSLFWGGLTVGRLISIPLAARVRPRYLLMADLAGLVLFLSLLLPEAMPSWVIWVGSFGVGLSMANVFPTLILLGERHMPITGGVTGWFLVGGSLGNMVVPWLIGQRFEASGPQATIVIILITVSLTAILLAAFLRASRISSKAS